jgi:hypothetical protein
MTFSIRSLPVATLFGTVCAGAGLGMLFYAAINVLSS